MMMGTPPPHTHTRFLSSLSRFYDAIITDPPYNIKEKVVTNNDTDSFDAITSGSSSSSSGNIGSGGSSSDSRSNSNSIGGGVGSSGRNGSGRVAQVGSNSTFVGGGDVPPAGRGGLAAPSGRPHDVKVSFRVQRKMDESLRRIDTQTNSTSACADTLEEQTPNINNASTARTSTSSSSSEWKAGGGAKAVANAHGGSGSKEWEAGGGAKAVAYSNSFVGDVVWSLLSLARYSLKPGGRLSFFLPLRGGEARLAELPAALVDKLGERDAHGERLFVVYTSKQRMTSPNMCRWLVVLEKH